MCEQLKNYKLWKIENGKAIEYGDYNRLKKVREVEERLQAQGFQTFVEVLEDINEKYKTN